MAAPYPRILSSPAHETLVKSCNRIYVGTCVRLRASSDQRVRPRRSPDQLPATNKAVKRNRLTASCLYMVAGGVTAVSGQPGEGELEGIEAVLETTLSTEDLLGIHR